MVLYITNEEVQGLVTMDDSIFALEQAFGGWSDASTGNLPRHRLPMPRRSLNIMAASLPGGDLFGYRGYYSGIRFNLLILLSLKQEKPLAFIESGWLSRIRTGAATGLATKYLAREDAKALAMIGTGKIAPDQIRAIAAVRRLERVRIFGRNAEKREAFAGQIAGEFGFTVETADSAEECLEGADIVTVATNAREPVVLGKWLAPGMHVNGVGANDGKRRELDEEAVLRSDIVAVDQRKQAQIEAGLLIDMARDGLLAWEDVAELGDIVEKAKPKRAGPDQITFFHSLGLAFEDVAFGALIYEKAVAAGVGRTV
ncbi:MAG: ornithine cyclodeaminase family protein [Rhodospirillales bacterium]